MAYGPPPKPAEKRARRNKDTIPTKVIEVVPGEQPELPAGHAWHPETLKWWEMWSRSPLSKEFTEADWAALADTALYHTAVWNGKLQYGGELRARVAKFGITPEDRARLRITFAIAEKHESAAPATRSEPKSAGNYGSLSLVEGD